MLSKISLVKNVRFFQGEFRRLNWHSLQLLSYREHRKDLGWSWHKEPRSEKTSRRQRFLRLSALDIGKEQSCRRQAAKPHQCDTASGAAIAASIISQEFGKKNEKWCSRRLRREIFRNKIKAAFFLLITHKITLKRERTQRNRTSRMTMSGLQIYVIIISAEDGVVSPSILA